jgi:cysteine desulfurase family protein
VIYLNNAATTLPKPKAVVRAMENAMKAIGENPGRGHSKGVHKADRLIYETRVRTAKFFGAKDPAKVIFTPGCTYSVNMALRGFLKKGDHVISTGRMHNALARTLYDKRLGIDLSTVEWDGKNPMNAEIFKSKMTGNTRAVVVNHASNVDGLLFPLREIGKAARELGLILIVDAAQTAGLVSIDMKRDNIGMLCVSGHKGLIGPSGIGILALASDVDIYPLVSGGTGSFSDEIEMPASYPDRLEAGTPNLIGIAGLGAGISFLQKTGLRKIFEHERKLSDEAVRGIEKLPGVEIFRPDTVNRRMPIFSFNIKGIDPSEIGDYLEKRYGIATRAGLHCAPHSHKEIGTYPQGLVRISPGFYNKKSEIKLFIKAVAEFIKRKKA